MTEKTNKPIAGPYSAWTPGRVFVGQERNFKQFCEIDSAHDFETRAVTACLMAAAPELLEALRHAQALILQNVDWRAIEHGQETVTEIANAIAKAELTRNV